MRTLGPMSLLASVFVSLMAACGSTSPTVAAPSAPATPADALTDGGAAAQASDPSAPVISTGGGDASTSPKLCGCSLCEPRFSDDACTSDADCAPAIPCHADRCVAKAKAKPRTPEIMCTEILKCDSVDANTCGCLKGKCALYPKK